LGNPNEQEVRIKEQITGLRKNRVMSDREAKSPILSTQRRKLLQLGAMTGAASVFTVLLGEKSDAGMYGPRGSMDKPSMRGQQARDRKMDIQLFNGAAILEQKAVNTYRAAAENNLLPTKAFLDVALQFAADHAQHHAKLQSVVADVLKGKPADTSNVGTFPIPQKVLKGGEAEVIRYALTLEMIASKTYLDQIQNKLTGRDAINVIATIMPVETMHAAVYRSVLMAMLKDKGLPGDDKLVPYPFLNEQPTPPIPQA
jgi:rubrerythrin